VNIDLSYLLKGSDSSRLTALWHMRMKCIFLNISMW